jgi:hypothetical protein
VTSARANATALLLSAAQQRSRPVPEIRHADQLQRPPHSDLGFLSGNFRALAGNATFSATVMCGQIA